MRNILIGLTIGLLSLLPQNSFATNTHSTDLETDSSQYWSITDGSQTGLDITGNLTIEAWVKLETDTTGNIVTKFNDDTNNMSYRFQYDAFSSILGLRLSANGSSGTTKSVTWNPTLNTWYHLAAVYNASAGTVDFYENGAQLGTQQSGLPTSIFNGNATFGIGAAIAASPSGFLDGLIDDVRIWNTTRTSSDISSNYNCAITGGETGLAGYWKFDNNGDDTTGNNNDLTNNNSATFSTNVPFSINCGETQTSVNIGAIIMSSTTDAIVGNYFELLFILTTLSFFLFVAYTFYTITKR